MSVNLVKDLANWTALNAALRRKTTTEKDCRTLLEAEAAGMAREQFLIRLHGALTIRQRRREREKLLRKAKVYRVTRKNKPSSGE